jgi:hypothetical protein
VFPSRQGYSGKPARQVRSVGFLSLPIFRSGATLSLDRGSCISRDHPSDGATLKTRGRRVLLERAAAFLFRRASIPADNAQQARRLRSLAADITTPSVKARALEQAQDMRRSPGSLRRARLAGNFKGTASAPVQLGEKLL